MFRRMREKFAQKENERYKERERREQEKSIAREREVNRVRSERSNIETLVRMAGDGITLSGKVFKDLPFRFLRSPSLSRLLGGSVRCTVAALSSCTSIDIDAGIVTPNSSPIAPFGSLSSRPETPRPRPPCRRSSPAFPAPFPSLSSPILGCLDQDIEEAAGSLFQIALTQPAVGG